MLFSNPCALSCVIISISLKDFLGLFIESPDRKICLYINGVILNGFFSEDEKPMLNLKKIKMPNFFQGKFCTFFYAFVV